MPRSFGGWLVRIVLYAWAFLAAAVIVVAVAAFVVVDHARGPGHAGPPITVTIPEGASGKDIGELLAQSGLIEHEGLFRLAAKLDTAKKPLKHGVYEIPKGLAALEILHLMQNGPARLSPEDQIKITVPEGLSAAQVVAALPEVPGLAEAIQAPEALARTGVKAKSLDGFLFPETYYFDKQPTGAELVDRMLTQFDKTWAKLVAEVPGAEKYDKLAVVTIASLIEEEAKVDEDRPLIAAVLRNRLQEGMPLQMDSTLQFALNKYGERLTEKDKQVDSAYNTYKVRGLPPGPISSPGIPSLRAALRPAAEPYLYFVSNADGRTHTFSKTYEEHQAAVARFRRDIAPQRKEQVQQKRATPAR